MTTSSHAKSAVLPPQPPKKKKFKHLFQHNNMEKGSPSRKTQVILFNTKVTKLVELIVSSYGYAKMHVKELNNDYRDKI